MQGVMKHRGSGLLWIAFAVNLLSVFLPAYNTGFIFEVREVSHPDAMSEFAYVMYWFGIILSLVAAVQIKKDENVMKYELPAAILLVIPLIGILSSMSYVDTETGFEVSSLGTGGFLLLIGIILTGIAAFYAKKVPAFPYHQPYQQQPYQQQPPQQQPYYQQQLPQQQPYYQPQPPQQQPYYQQPAKSAELREVYCPECGNSNEPGEAYCGMCGSKLK
jgi:hypothetical protein